MLLLGIFICIPSVLADSGSETNIGERLVLHYDSSRFDPPDIDMIRAVCTNSSVDSIETCAPLSFVVISVSSPDAESVYEVLHTLPFVTDVEYDNKRYACTENGNDTVSQTGTRITPNDPRYSFQWNIADLNISHIREFPETSNICVSIIDSGIDYRNADITDQYVSGGYDWFGKDTDPVDWDGHGTHLAGIVGATINNGIGMSGIANVSLMAERVYDKSYTAYASDTACAIVHAADCGADIILLGYGGGSDSRAEAKAVNYAAEKGCIIIAPAGNDDSNMPHYPSDLLPVMSVGSYNRVKERSSFSNYGIYLEIMAPGEDILSTHPDDRYVYQSGTSQAAAMVAGVAALICSLHPDADADTIRTCLDTSAYKKGGSDRDIYYGYGCIDAYQAHRCLLARTEGTAAVNQTVPGNDTDTDTFMRDIDIQLQIGWNCISFPAPLVANETLYDLFSSVDTGGHTLWKYMAEREGDGWVSLTREYVIEPLEGIFVYVVQPITLTVSLPGDSHVRRNLYPGWNTVGIPKTDSLSASEAFRTLGDNWVTLLDLNVSSGYYDTTVVNGGEGLFSDRYLVQPYTGYWIYMREEDTLTD